jgi:putative intracellular protease/amidase
MVVSAGRCRKGPFVPSQVVIAGTGIPKAAAAQLPEALRAHGTGGFDSGKTVAAVCHAPWMLVEADILGGRAVTSWPSIRTDLINAGAGWVDREVVEDGNLITSRKPADLPAFSDAIQRHAT